MADNLPDLPQRWKFQECEMQMWLDEDGDYVEWNDYEKLRGYTAEQQKGREQAEKQRNDLLTELDDLQCGIASALGWPDGGPPFLVAVRELREHAEKAEARVGDLEAEVKRLREGGG